MESGLAANGEWPHNLIPCQILWKRSASDVAFSFAGAHRDRVREIAELVAAQLGQGRVFFDQWYEHEIIGRDMDVLLARIYREQSLFVVADLSDEYAIRPWTQAEARGIRELGFEIDSARNETQRLRVLYEPTGRLVANTRLPLYNFRVSLDGNPKALARIESVHYEFRASECSAEAAATRQSARPCRKLTSRLRLSVLVEGDIAASGATRCRCLPLHEVSAQSGTAPCGS